MESCRKRGLIIIHSFLLTIGMLAVMLLAVGCFTQLWLNYEIKINIQRVFSPSTKKTDTVSIGLWTVTACETDESGFLYVVKPVTECKTATIEQLNEAIDMSGYNDTAKENGKKFLDSFLPQKILTVTGGLLGICSFAMTVAFTKSEPTEKMSSYIVSGVTCIISWIISGGLVLTAVGLQTYKNANFEREVKMEAAKPELRDILTVSVDSSVSIILIGIGGAFEVLLAIFLAVLLIFGIRIGIPDKPYTEQTILQAPMTSFLSNR